MRFGGAAIALLLGGCSSEPPEVGCLPGVSCEKAIDWIENGEGCSGDGLPPHTKGMCGSLLGCEPGYTNVDGDAANGCEAVGAFSDADWFATGNGDGLGMITVNEFTTNLGIAVELLALDLDDPSCPPVTFERSCFYTLHRLEFSLPTFTLDDVLWTSGVGTIHGPVPAEDDASGPWFSAPMVVAFTVQQGDLVRQVASLATAGARITRSGDEPDGSLYLRTAFDFGRYSFSEVVVDQSLEFN